jgi:hypothetical protein
MDIASLVTGLGIGGLAGVIFRAQHERAESRRDRMIAVAEEFLHAVEDAFDATDMARRTVKTRLEGSETPNRLGGT